MDWTQQKKKNQSIQDKFIDIIQSEYKYIKEQEYQNICAYIHIHMKITVILFKIYP